MEAEEIKRRRKELGYTQETLAKRLGVSLRTVVNYENGAKIPESKYVLLHEMLGTASNDPTSQDTFSMRPPFSSKKISKREIYRTVKNLLLHEDQLMSNEMFVAWKENIRLKAENTLLTQLAETKLDKVGGLNE